MGRGAASRATGSFTVIVLATSPRGQLTGQQHFTNPRGIRGVQSGLTKLPPKWVLCALR